MVTRAEKIQAIKAAMSGNTYPMFSIRSKLAAVKMAELMGIDDNVVEVYGKTEVRVVNYTAEYEWEKYPELTAQLVEKILNGNKQEDISSYFWYEMVGNGSASGWCFAPDFIEAIFTQGWVRLHGEIITLGSPISDGNESPLIELVDETDCSTDVLRHPKVIQRAKVLQKNSDTLGMFRPCWRAQHELINELFRRTQLKLNRRVRRLLQAAGGPKEFIAKAKTVGDIVEMTPDNIVFRGHTSSYLQELEARKSNQIGRIKNGNN
jgi:hypothetical protein